VEQKFTRINRRDFIKGIGAAVAGAAIFPATIESAPKSNSTLQVWSCGGLAEAFGPANERFQETTGVSISYTGAFAGALGKSLLGGAQTEIFAGRVLKLAKDLRAAGKMLYFRPLCFTDYVLVTPKGNPAKISSIQDLARADVRVYLPVDASPPGGAAVVGIIKKAKIDKDVLPRLARKESCVIRMMTGIVEGKGHVSIVERRLTCMAKFEGKVDIIPIPWEYFPPGPLTFTVGVMKYAKDRKIADTYVDFICSSEGQAFFERQGFITAQSDRGKELIKTLGVKDV
jgi:molybdate transport system substrate-binding protein